MNALTKDSTIPAEVGDALHEALEDVSKGIRDPAKVKIACEEMDRIREEIRKTHGVLDIGVPAIREMRDA